MKISRTRGLTMTAIENDSKRPRSNKLTARKWNGIFFEDFEASSFLFQAFHRYALVDTGARDAHFPGMLMESTQRVWTKIALSNTRCLFFFEIIGSRLWKVYSLWKVYRKKTESVIYRKDDVCFHNPFFHYMRLRYASKNSISSWIMSFCGAIWMRWITWPCVGGSLLWINKKQNTLRATQKTKNMLEHVFVSEGYRK